MHAMARTILDEVLRFRPDFIEHPSTHAVRDPDRRAYNRTAFLPKRRLMMQIWADYRNRLRAGEEPDTNATASMLSEVQAYRAHDGRLP